jgi:ABC-type nitrate/sulfonate/bicarbonate transport system substrate-binding protein
MKGRVHVGLSALLLLLLWAAPGPAAPTPVRLRMSVLSFPATSAFVGNIIRERGLDQANGLVLELVPFASISAYYAALATGEVDTLLGGPHVLQKMRLEGVRIQGVATLVRLSDLVVITRHPEIRTFADLRGRTLAADMGSQQYQILAIYARWKGLTLGQDVTVVQASFPLARAQLAAGRVDAALIIEPQATLALRDNPAYRIVLNGRSAWREITGSDGWELIAILREDVTRRTPRAVSALLATLRAFQDDVRTNLDLADQIVARTTGLPRGAFREAVLFRRLAFEVRPVWGGERKVLWQMFQVAVEYGVIPKLPDDGVLYRP